jgi:hypothetical protein
LKTSGPHKSTLGEKKSLAEENWQAANLGKKIFKKFLSPL